MDNEKTNPNPIEKLQSFDIGERLGGTQLIIDYRAISPTEFYVMTLGNGPKVAAIPNLNTKLSENEDNKIKIRFFKLTFVEGTTYSIDEFVTPESISKVASLFTNS